MRWKERSPSGSLRALSPSGFFGARRPSGSLRARSPSASVHLSLSAFPPSSSSADEHELHAVFPNRRRFHALASHWCARRTSPAPPGGLKPDTVGGGCPVCAGLRRPPRRHNGAGPVALARRLQLPAALGAVLSAN